MKTALLALLLISLAAPPQDTTTIRADSAPGDLAGKLGPHTRHPEAAKAIEQLKSPYCPGFMLNVCSSAQGAALRDSIEWMAEAGLPSDSIVAWVLANHGDTLLALPPTTGKGLLAWVVPPVAVLLGLVLVLVALKRLRGSQEPRDLPAAVSPEDERRLAEALRQLDEEEESPFV
jgi:cytochrome c-type biogenesis protein CcmH/NrfF